MIRWIVKKEFVNNIQSFRFFTLFALTVILFAINAFVSSKEYRKDLMAYSKCVTKHSTYFYRAFGAVPVDKRPNPLAFVIDGQSRKQDRTLNIACTGDIAPVGIVYSENYLLQDFQIMDWAFIIKLLFSIFALLLTFDAICGEKQRGTLALVCSNSVSRASVILGKYLGAISTLIVPLFTGILVNMVIINFLGRIDLSAQMIVRIGLVVLLALIYLSVFALLGLFISSATHRAATSLLLNLGAWLALVMVIPTLAGLAGEHLPKVPTESEFAQRQDDIYQIHRDRTYGQKLLQDIVKSKRLTDPEEIQTEAMKLMSKAAEEKAKLNQDIWHAVESKENLARSLARVSPSAEFQFGSESLVFTGTIAERSFYRAAQNFVAVYQDYIQDKTGVMYKFDPVYRPWQIEVQGKTLSISAPVQPRLPKGLTDFPEFNQSYPSLPDSVKSGIVDITSLSLWNVLLFLLTMSFFVRYDVR